MATYPLQNTHLCRLCAVEVGKRSTSLFSPPGLQQKWASRIQDLLLVGADCNDGLPGYICDKCKRRFVGLERAAEDLVHFREQARKSHKRLAHCRGALKRTKDTSRSFASPDTVQARLPSNRTTTAGKRLDFGQGLISECEQSIQYLQDTCK